MASMTIRPPIDLSEMSRKQCPIGTPCSDLYYDLGHCLAFQTTARPIESSKRSMKGGGDAHLAVTCTSSHSMLGGSSSLTLTLNEHSSVLPALSVAIARRSERPSPASKVRKRLRLGMLHNDSKTGERGEPPWSLPNERTRPSLDGSGRE